MVYNGLNKMSKANGTNKQRRFWLPTSEKFGSEGSSPSLIHSYLLLCAFLIYNVMEDFIILICSMIVMYITIKALDKLINLIQKKTKK